MKLAEQQKLLADLYTNPEIRDRYFIENKENLETTKLELTSTQERIEDVKQAVDIKNVAGKELKAYEEDPLLTLINFANSYIKKTSVPDYSDRLKLKAEFGRIMGDLIIRNNLSKKDLYEKYPSEGMFLALSYSAQLQPENDSLEILNLLAVSASQLYTKYSILVGYRTLARINFIQRSDVKNIYNLITSFLYLLYNYSIRKAFYNNILKNNY